MSNDEQYTQCKLETEDNEVYVAWIPKKFAKKNKQLKINDKSVIVVEVYVTKHIDDIYQTDYKYHRRNTDI